MNLIKSHSNGGPPIGRTVAIDLRRRPKEIIMVSANNADNKNERAYLLSLCGGAVKY